MTTYFQPLQREKDHRWDYTRCTGSTRPHAIGYCTGSTDDPEYSEKYHVDGHATADEATRCYRQWQLDHRLQLHPNPTNPHEQRKCESCGVWTSGHATMIDGARCERWFLCPEHCTKEQVTALYLK